MSNLVDSSVFAVHEDAVRGRGLRAKRSYSQYEEVIVAEARLMVVRQDASDWTCQNCFAYTKQAIQCGGCAGRARYCSAKCQEYDRVHPAECKLWAQEPEYPHFSLIQLFRALQRVKSGDSAFKAVVSDLVSYEDERGLGWDGESEAALIHWIVSMRTYCPEAIPDGWDDARLRRVYFALKLNAFNVKSGGEASRACASGLFPSLALFNHSCRPNVGIQFVHGVDLRLVALRPISTDEELCIAYTNPFVSESERNSVLKKNFFFSCACEHCKALAGLPTDDELRETFSNEREDLSSRLAKFKDIRATEETVTIIACGLFSEAMNMRARNELDETCRSLLLDLFVDQDGSLRTVRTVSPDLYWQWVVFFVDLAARLGRAEAKQKIAAHGLQVACALHPDAATDPMIQPYIGYFQSHLA